MATGRQTSVTPTTWQIRVAGAAIVIAVCAAYVNSLRAGFVFDDVPGIVLNETIRDLGNPVAVFSPPPEAAGAGGRPLVNLTFALNYAVGGLDPRGYHLVNVVIHALAALTLSGLVRHTLLRPPLRERFAPAALPVAGASTLVWALHPLLTESVTFAVQRNESMVGLFLLLTLYCFVRSADSPAPRRWLAAMVAAGFAGVLTKEVMAVAPLLAVLYDRTFVSGTFREAWRRHGRWFLALAASWLVLAVLVAGASKRGGTVGFGLGVDSWHYLLTQCRAILLYLRLALWPHPLVVDYGTDVVSHLPEVLPHALLLVALFGATVVGLVRRPVWGFVGVWWFVILAPSSSIVPLTTQTMAEHRMYLPLLAVVVPVMCGLYRLAGRHVLLIVTAVLALAGGSFTAQRNRAYESEITIWRDTIAKRPGNFRAHYDLGTALSAANQPREAIEQFRLASRIRPDDASAQYNLGLAFVKLDRWSEAEAAFREALRLDPRSYDAHTNLGHVLHTLSRFAEAEAHYRAALELKPDLVAAHSGLGGALEQLGRGNDAVEAYRAALRLDPANANARYNLGTLYLRAGVYARAIAELSEALRLQPDFPEARNNLEIAQRRAGGR